ncbi:MAG TPA: NADH-quinone oxidoreductase subunit A [Elusimicrobiales bacterium]|nr:NADH-quinone oxidoreductase subunit A [Elusimicrobiales bacterium]
MDILLFPPVVFIISLLFALALAELVTPLAAAPKRVPGSAKHNPYGCGEDVPGDKVDPDYHGFFPFAIFFTLLHVAGLMLATWSFAPVSTGAGLVFGYVAAVAVILAILFVD